MASHHADEVLEEPSALRRSVFSLLPGVDEHGRAKPIEYSIKVSAKAKQVYLRVVPGRGLQVTIPKRYPKRAIPELVESQRAWILDALQELENQIPERYREWPPTRLNLIAEHKTISISYRTAAHPEEAKWRWTGDTELKIEVDTSNKALVAGCIADALKPLARDILQPWLETRSHQSGLSYKRLLIRGQRTVWGSFSSTGTLSLNYKLLFIGPELVDYVLLHELAHTQHLDHSPEFWRLLESLKPGAKALDAQLDSAAREVPPWLELAGAT